MILRLYICLSNDKSTHSILNIAVGVFSSYQVHNSICHKDMINKHTCANQLLQTAPQGITQAARADP